jgi:hypothetical protein
MALYVMRHSTLFAKFCVEKYFLYSVVILAILVLAGNLKSHRKYFSRQEFLNGQG